VGGKLMTVVAITCLLHTFCYIKIIIRRFWTGVGTWRSEHGVCAFCARRARSGHNARKRLAKKQHGSLAQSIKISGNNGRKYGRYIRLICSL